MKKKSLKDRQILQLFNQSLSSQTKIFIPPGQAEQKSLKNRVQSMRGPSAGDPMTQDEKVER